MSVRAARVPEKAGTGVVVFPAEVDLSNADDVLSEALRLIREGATGIVLDLGGCAFCDSSGPNVIFRARARAAAADIPLVVVLPTRGIVRKICDIAGVTRDIDHATSLAAARDRLGRRP
ncbi:STAS domain-containing protein [Spirillospora sp. NPDC029432]|uniref:STAS domain-containing protein n=1 Tax=Spirillospora sp. NPDC029432 TaxID=3154599 RepID=UPI003455192A